MARISDPAAPDRGNPTIGVVPRNNLYLTFAALYETQAQIGDAIGRVEHSLPDPAIVVDRLGGIAKASETAAQQTAAGLKAIDARLAGVAESVAMANATAGRAAAALERIARQMPEPEVPEIDLCTALYAAAVDVTGNIVQRTGLGRLLGTAGYSSLGTLGDDRGKFIQDVQAAFKSLSGKGSFASLAPFMDDDVLACFWAKAKAVLKGIQQTHGEARPPDAQA